jgi:prepilin-type N-terminal cleavage/methylation domain-containing protein
MSLKDERGFTLPEVLVTMLILGILAGILLSQLGPREADAQDADAKTSARTMHAHVESCFVETEDYGRCESSDPELGETRQPIGAGPGQIRIDSKDKHSYTIASRSRSGTTFFLVKSQGGKPAQTCDRDYAGCRAGAW